MPLSAPLYQLKRRAKLLARTEAIPLHAALDRVAAEQGFTSWSLLSARAAASEPAMPVTREADLLARLVPGDVVLLGARPGHGKTRLGLRLLIDAARDGRRAVFFTLEYSEREAEGRIRSLAGDGGMNPSRGVEVVASDDICADTVARHLAGAARGTVAVIDYLQLLDQRRTKPPVSEQVNDLRRLARARGFVLAVISQIDRSFDADGAAPPGLRDVRLPNPVDLRAFSKACFLHGGAMTFQETRQDVA